MKKLKNGETVNLLFFGQSNIEDNAAGAYTREIWNDLKRRFPTATINYLNTAKGACEADCMLSGQIAGRIEGKNADLVVLNIWGWEFSYERLIDRIKADSPPYTEILVLNWQVGSFSSADEMYWKQYISWYWMPEVCRRRGLGWCDLLTGYIKYLKDNHGGLNGYKAVMPDGMHHNAEGSYLMGELIKPYFVLREETTPPAIDSVWSVGGAKLFVRFNKFLDKVTSQVAANYTVSLNAGAQAVQVNSTVLNNDGCTVALELEQRCEGTVTVSVKGVRDEVEPVNEIATPSAKTVTIPAATPWNFESIGFMGITTQRVTETSATSFTLTGGGEKQVLFTAEIAIGLYLCGGRYASSTTVDFSNVSITGNAVPVVTPLLSHLRPAIPSMLRTGLHAGKSFSLDGRVMRGYAPASRMHAVQMSIPSGSSSAKRAVRHEVE